MEVDRSAARRLALDLERTKSSQDHGITTQKQKEWWVVSFTPTRDGPLRETLRSTRQQSHICTHKYYMHTRVGAHLRLTPVKIELKCGASTPNIYLCTYEESVAILLSRVGACLA